MQVIKSELGVRFTVTDTRHDTFGSVQFSSLTAWVVGESWRTIQLILSSNLFCKGPLRAVLAWTGMSTLWCPSSIFSDDDGVANPPRCPGWWFSTGCCCVWHAGTMQVSVFWKLPEKVPAEGSSTRKLILLHTLLRQVRSPGAVRDFSPRVNFQCRLSFSVCTPPCTSACNNICAHIKGPAVHVRFRCFMETLKHPACTLGLVVWLSSSWLSTGETTQISHVRNPNGKI